jgi:hypothetical protein
MKIPLKAITITYTKTITVAPISEMFEDWDVEPSQEGFESMMMDEFYDMIYEEVGGNGDPKDSVNLEQFETVEIDWYGWVVEE